MIKKPTSKQCEFVKNSGGRCRAKPLSGSKLCFFHDPAKATERRAAKQKGGRCRRIVTLPKQTVETKIRTAGDVVELLSATINQVRGGEIDPRIANAVGYLSGIILKAKEQGEIEQRLQQVEEIVRKGDTDHVTRLYPSSR